MNQKKTHEAQGHAPRRRVIFALAMITLSVVVQLLLVAPLHAQPPGTEVIQRLQDGRHVLMIRHANAPGVGDPAQFQIGDCSTQRNLDDAGRAQARAIGAWLQARGVGKARIYSSQWCRCLETATLLGFGDPIELPALNSFYELTQNREPNLRALREFLATRPTDGVPIVLVTHQVTISEFSDGFVSSGEGVLIEIEDAKRFTERARLAFDD